MNYEQIEKLIDKVNKSKITELSVEEGNFKLNIKAEQSVAMAALTVPAICLMLMEKLLELWA